MARFDLATKQGETYTRSLRWDKNTGTEESPVWTAYDLAGTKALLQIRERPASPVITSVSTEDGGISVSIDNKITIEISAAKTDLLVAKRYYYDLLVEFPDGKVRRLLEGQVRNSLSITDVEALLL